METTPPAKTLAEIYEAISLTRDAQLYDQLHAFMDLMQAEEPVRNAHRGSEEHARLLLEEVAFAVFGITVDDPGVLHWFRRQPFATLLQTFVAE